MTQERLEKFLDESWIPFLHPFFENAEWKNINDSLKNLKSKGVILAPLEKNIFRAFKECSFLKLNTLIIADNPYQGWDNYSKLPLNDGIAFSCKNSYICPKELENILYSLDDLCWTDTYPYLISARENYDLKKLANQGYLMINTSLTTTMKGPVINGTDEHYIIWRPFLKMLCRTINLWLNNICVVLIGKHAQTLENYFVNETNHVFKIDSPKTENIKDYKNMFETIRNIHKSQNIEIDYSE